jgi:hypothetical protein
MLPHATLINETYLKTFLYSIWGEKSFILQCHIKIIVINRGKRSKKNILYLEYQIKLKGPKFFMGINSGEKEYLINMANFCVA